MTFFFLNYGGIKLGEREIKQVINQGTPQNFKKVHQLTHKKHHFNYICNTTINNNKAVSRVLLLRLLLWLRELWLQLWLSQQLWLRRQLRLWLRLWLRQQL